MLEPSDIAQRVKLETTVGNALVELRRGLLPEKVRSDKLAIWVLGQDSGVTIGNVPIQATTQERTPFQTSFEHITQQFFRFYRCSLVYIGRRWRVSELALNALTAASDEGNLVSSVEQTKRELSSVSEDLGFEPGALALLPEALRRLLRYGKEHHESELAKARAWWDLWRLEVGAFQATYVRCEDRLSMREADKSFRSLMSLFVQASNKSKLQESLEGTDIQFKSELFGGEGSKAAVSIMLAAWEHGKTVSTPLTEEAPMAPARGKLEGTGAGNPRRINRICFDRIIPESYAPARVMAQRAAVSHYVAILQAMSGLTTKEAPPRASLGQLVAKVGNLEELDANHPITVARMAIIAHKQWDNGYTLRCKFLDGDEVQRQKVMDNARKWEEYANIQLNFGDDPDAEIRISFEADSGSWSAVGTDCLITDYFPQYQPTMNFGWLRDDTDDQEYERVVMHEFGHALGCIHEHQQPHEHLKWDLNAVYEAFSGPPNYWGKEDIDHNILEKYSPNGLSATRFDPKSIMLYQFDGSLFTDGRGTPLNAHLSKLDEQMIGQMYPKAAGHTVAISRIA